MNLAPLSANFGRWAIFIVSMVFVNEISVSQVLYYQDIFRGGVTAGGFSSSPGYGEGVIEVYIEPNSTIRKSLLYFYRIGESLPISYVEIANQIIVLDSTSQVTPTILNNWWGILNFTVHVIDLTEILEISENLIPINIPLPSIIPCSNCGFWAMYLVVMYENSNLENVCYSGIVNNQECGFNVVNQISGLNPINVTSPVGLALHFDRLNGGETLNDGSHIFVNENNYLGLVKGADAVNSAHPLGGVKGHFYYQNSQLIGLDDDIGNDTMNDSDALADISGFLTENTTSLDVEVQYESVNNVYTNMYLSYHFAYTTPCQSFETTLTEEVTICRGDSAMLLATGGSTGSVPGYEWLPQEDLSCYDCPNPVFTGEQTRHYTVRIWNTDSCSKVLPVKVLVHDVPTQANLTLTPATCSESNGSMSINNVVGGTPQYVYNIGGNNSTNPNFNNLAPGVYNLQITDANSCTYNQSFTIEEVNPITAAFNANPQNGIAPLNVNFTNQSTGANLYQWLVNTQTFESTNLNYTFDTAGIYTVQLIAWFNEPHCADTTQKVIVVENAFSAIIPTLHASSHGFWSIQTTNVTHAKVQIYNAIGQLIHQTEQAVSNGPNPIWNSTGKATGYYFYRIQLTDIEGKEHGYEGKVLVVR